MQSHIVRQPYVGAGTCTAALMIGAGVYLANPALPGREVSLPHLTIAGALIAAVMLAYEFPIYIRHKVKLCVSSVPLFLLAVLLPPFVAALAAALALLGGELAVRSKRGSPLSMIATNVGRWTAIIVAGSAVAHLSAGSGAAHDATLLLAAVVLWCGDIITLPLGLTPVTGEHPERIIQGAVREGGIAEAAQYGLGVLGFLLIDQQIWAIAMLVLPAGLIYLAFKKEVDTETFQLLESMADRVDLRDPAANEHSRRVAQLVRDVLDRLQMHGQEAHHIMVAARLHDIGKIRLPDELWIKTAPLSPEERTLMESYPARGAELLAAYPDLSRSVEMVLHHLERWDGAGYPGKLGGPDIPFGARMIAVADSYDALTHDRPYRYALSPDQAAEILIQGRGRQWDPEMVDIFLIAIKDRLEHPIPVPATEGIVGGPVPEAHRVLA